MAAAPDCTVCDGVDEAIAKFAAGLTVKLSATSGAAAYLELPAWLASIVQVPVATSVTVVPETVQTEAVAEEKLTGSPEVAVAVSAGTAVPMVCVPGLGKVMVCVSSGARLTVKLSATSGAAAYLESPAWLATMVQVPVLMGELVRSRAFFALRSKSNRRNPVPQ